MNGSYLGRRRGFTLIELLVVIVIIAALAGLTFAVLPRIMRKAKATEAMANLRQFGPLLTTYATDHGMKLPAAEENEELVDGVLSRLKWTEVCLNLLVPDTAFVKFSDKKWWEQNKPFVRNPLYKSWTPATPGYALNLMPAVNIDGAGGTPSGTDPLQISVPLASISEPARTPLVTPGANYFYRLESAGDATGFKTGASKELLVDGKLMVLFMDGHVESLTPDEYLSRKLYELPR